MPPAPTPVTVTIYTYQVGFGDCFLLRFDYDDHSRKHILVDFGTTGLPKDDASASMLRVAQSIAAECDGKLDVIVATHRHADHISGFATSDDGKGSGDIIRALKPERVLQPWTETPDAPLKWDGPIDDGTPLSFAHRVQSLDAMHAISGAVVQRLDRDGGFDDKWPLAARLRFLGEDNIKNVSAVNNLRTMAPNLYLFHGCDLDLSTILPNVDIHVLGPPTLVQSRSIKAYAKSSPDYWLRAQHLVALAASGTAGHTPDTTLFPRLDKTQTFYGTKLPHEMRWLAKRVDAAEAEQMLGIVTALDRVMNNTSLILLFAAGSRKLLFPGDAQVENWSYALQSDMADLLDDVDLYKVGHHGSLNATPKTLWDRLKKKGKADKVDRLKSIMSTMADKHGGKHGAPTEVPRKPLVDDLKAQSDLLNTQDFAKGEIFRKVTLDLR